MSVYAGPEIVNNTLLLCLDASNTKSYPGSGTTLYNAINNSVSGSFVGSPTYNSAGYLTFSGTGQYITYPSNANFALGTADFTIDMWFNPANTSQNAGLFQLSPTATYFQSTFANQLSVQLLGSYIQLGYNSSWNVGNGVAINQYSANRWYNVTISRISSVTRFYINTQQVSSDLADTGNYTGTYLIVAGFYGSPYVLNGSMSNFKIYKNRGLTLTEIQQNFNALRGRFGI